MLARRRGRREVPATAADSAPRRPGPGRADLQAYVDLVAELGAEVIRQLAALGLVESRPGVGTFVRAVRRARPADLSWQTAALGGPQTRLPSVSSTQRAAVPDAISLRMARGPSRDRILADRAAETMHVSGVLQVAALDVVTQPGWRTHLKGMRRQLRARCDLLWTACGRTPRR